MNPKAVDQKHNLVVAKGTVDVTDMNILAAKSPIRNLYAGTVLRRS